MVIAHDDEAIRDGVPDRGPESATISAASLNGAGLGRLGPGSMTEQGS
jgi:hypothetical protein